MLIVSDRYLIPSQNKMICYYGNERFYFTPSCINNIYFQEVVKHQKLGPSFNISSKDSDLIPIITKYYQSGSYETFQKQNIKTYITTELPQENSPELLSFTYMQLLKFINRSQALDKFIIKTDPANSSSGITGIFGLRSKNSTPPLEHVVAKKLKQLLDLAPKNSVSFSREEIGAIKTNFELKRLFIESSICIGQQTITALLNSTHSTPAIITRDGNNCNISFTSSINSAQ